MIKLLDQKQYIFMDEYYVLYFYQVRPTIKYYLVFKIIYYKKYIIYFYVKNKDFFGYNFFWRYYEIKA